MLMSIEYIIKDLKKARKLKSMTQRELSKKSKIPQSHISKIESGVVDLHISSLVELSRLLDLEVMLVPRQLTSIVLALQNADQSVEQVPRYQLNNEEDD